MIVEISSLNLEHLGPSFFKDLAVQEGGYEFLLRDIAMNSERGRWLLENCTMLTMNSVVDEFKEEIRKTKLVRLYGTIESEEDQLWFKLKFRE